MMLTIRNRIRIALEAMTICSGHAHKAHEKQLTTFKRGYYAGMKDAELATENHRLRIALHEAINRRRGIVPHEAEEFYEQDFYSITTAQ